MSPEQRKKLFVFILILLSFLFLLTFFSENSAGDERKYYTYDGVVNQINVWALEHGDIVKVSNLSEIYNVENTYQGRNLWVVRVSDENNAGENGEKESQVLFLGGFEGRNWLSVEISMDLLRTLVENYEKDERIRSLIENNEIYVVPVVNPDGFQYSREHDNASNEGEGGWVKNRNATKDFGVYGVNINRNFDILWRNDLESGINDTSGTPSDFSYAGESPESEYETKALIELIKDKNFSFVILFDEKGRRVMTIPFAKDKAPFAKDSTHLQNSTDEETLNMLADYLASFLNYTVVEENPYYISGDFLDWCYAEHKLLSLKIAVGDSFIPAESDISNITANYTEMCLNAVELSYYFKNLSYINSMENEEDWIVFSSQKVWSHILEEETSYDGKGYWGVEGFENHATGSLETESFINLEGLKNPKLSFFQRYELEVVSSEGSGGAEEKDWYAGDGGFVEVKELGEEYKKVYPTTGYPYKFSQDYTHQAFRGEWAFSGSAPQWHKVVFDLQEFKGKQIKIRFRFSSNEKNNSGGWWLDHLFIYDGKPPRYDMEMKVEKDGVEVFPGKTATLFISLTNRGEKTDHYILTGGFLKGNETGNLNFSFSSQEISLIPSQKELVSVYIGAKEKTLESGEIILKIEALSEKTGEKRIVNLSARFGEVYDFDFVFEKNEMEIYVNSSTPVPFWLNSSSNVDLTILLNSSTVPEGWKLQYRGQNYTDEEFKNIAVSLSSKENRKDWLNLISPPYEKAGTLFQLTFNASISGKEISRELLFSWTVAETNGVEFLIPAEYEVTPGKENYLSLVVKNTGNVAEHIFLNFPVPAWNITLKNEEDEEFFLEPKTEKIIYIKVAPGQATEFGELVRVEIEAKVKKDNVFIYSTQKEIQLRAGVSRGGELEVVNYKKVIKPGEVGEFSFSIKNTGNKEDAFYLKYGVPSKWDVSFKNGEGPFTISPFSSYLVRLELKAGEGSYKDMVNLEFWAESEDEAVRSEEILLSITIGPLVDFTVNYEEGETPYQVLKGESFNLVVSVKNKGNGQMPFFINATSVPEGWSYQISSSEFNLNKNKEKDVTISLTPNKEEVGVEKTYTFLFSVECLGTAKEVKFEILVKEKGGGTVEEKTNLIFFLTLAIILVGAVATALFAFREKIFGKFISQPSQPPKILTQEPPETEKEKEIGETPSEEEEKEVREQPPPSEEEKEPQEEVVEQPVPSEEEEKEDEFAPPIEEDEDFAPPIEEEPKKERAPTVEMPEEKKKESILSGMPVKRKCPNCGRTMYIRDFSKENRCFWCGTYIKFKIKKEN